MGATHALPASVNVRSLARGSGLLHQGHTDTRVADAVVTVTRRLMSVSAPEGQASLVFAAVFVIVWCGAAVVTANAQLLGGNVYVVGAVARVGAVPALFLLCVLLGWPWWLVQVVLSERVRPWVLHFPAGSRGVPVLLVEQHRVPTDCCVGCVHVGNQRWVERCGVGRDDAPRISSHRPPAPWLPRSFGGLHVTAGA